MKLGVKLNKKPQAIGNRNNLISTMGHKMFDKPENIGSVVSVHGAYPDQNQSNSTEVQYQSYRGNSYKDKKSKPFVLEKQRKKRGNDSDDSD